MSGTAIEIKKSLSTAAIAILLIAMVLYRLTTTVADTDLWGYLAFGRLFWETGRFPYQDIFSYVPTLDPWIYHEWLTGVIFYQIYHYFGPPGLQLLKYCLAMLTVFLVYKVARGRGADPLAAALGVFLIHSLLRMGYSPVRAQVFTYAFFALYLYVLETARRTASWRGLYLLPGTQVLWCNLHAGFVSGLGLIALYGLGEALSRRPFLPYVLALIAATLATLINPYGLAYWHYTFQAIFMPRPEIQEWDSVFQAWQTAHAILPLFTFFLLNILALLWLIRWREIPGGLVLGVALYLGWRHLRHQIFFLLLAGAYLPILLSAYLQDLRSRGRLMAGLQRLGWQIPTVLGFLITAGYFYHIVHQAPLSLTTPALPGAETQTYYPLGAIDYVKKRGLSGDLLIHFDWGEYAIWTLYPHCRVALDGRFETVYPRRVAQEYFDFFFGRANWRNFLEKYPPRMILLDSRLKVAELVQADSQWRQAYADTGCVLFLRRD